MGTKVIDIYTVRGLSITSYEDERGVVVGVDRVSQKSGMKRVISATLGLFLVHHNLPLSSILLFSL